MSDGKQLPEAVKESAAPHPNPQRFDPYKNFRFTAAAPEHPVPPNEPDAVRHEGDYTTEE